MNILQESITIVNRSFASQVSVQQRQLFQFATAAFILSPRFESLNHNARLVIENTNTASSKLFRLLRNDTLLQTFPQIVSKNSFICSDSVVIIDFSTFCGFQVLTLAVQTYQGRAVPLYFDCITYPILSEGSQNIFIIETIRSFLKERQVKPAFVLDRGFAIPSLIQFFVQEQILFYVRCKQGKTVTLPDRKGKECLMVANKLKQTVDTTVKAYDNLTVRLIKSDFDSKKHKEPWYIITNDFELQRKEIIDIYYYRFEIEETFKDLKHLFGLKKLCIKKMMSFKVLLWCMILKVVLAYLIHEKMIRIHTHAKKQLSFVRIFSESLQRSILTYQLPPSWKHRF